MNTDNKLLTIGQMAKLTGVSVRALHYYERKNILKPAHIDQQTGYRYYNPDQIPIVDMISGCVVLDIPLNDLADALSANNMDSLYQFFQKNKEIAEQRARLVNYSIQTLDKILTRMELGNIYAQKRLYKRPFPRKLYAIKPYKEYLNNNKHSFLEMARESFGDEYSRSAFQENIDEVVILPDFGLLHRVSPHGTEAYIFAEITEKTQTHDCIVVPAGTYYFRQDLCSNIEQASTLFATQLTNISNYLLIETEEPFLSKTVVSEPMYELKLIPMP